MALSAEFLAACADPFGEALTVRVAVWIGGGAWDLSTPWPVVGLNPVVSRREYDYGVVQGQSIQVQLDNSPKTFPTTIIRGLWCVVEAGYPVANEWAPLCQGRIARLMAAADATVTLEITDAVTDLLSAGLPRDIRFQSAGWVSGVNVERKASTSSAWATGVALTLLAPTVVDDETFIVEFTSATAYKIVLENGTATQTGTTAANKTIANVAGDANVLTIPAAGWTGGTFATGARFVFYTARSRTANERTPIYMIEHLLTDFLGLSVFDVRGGAAYAYPWDDNGAWTVRADLAVTNGHEIAGTFPAGTPIIGLIQGCLQIVHGSIFPTPTGQLGLWVAEPYSGVVVALNGDPATGPVAILDGATIDDGTDNAFSEVVFRYLALGGGDAEYRAVDATTTLPVPRTKEIRIPWELRGLSAKDSADRFLVRYRNGQKTFTVPATLAAFPARVGGGIVITEPSLTMDGETNEITEVAIDALANTVTIKAQSDPVAGAGWFRLNLSTLDGSAVLW